MVGPEAGTLFWLGGPAGTEILFANWATGEPNNAFGPASESRLGWSELGWNDLPDSGFGSVKPGYIVEFSSIPEPPSFNLFGLGLILVGLSLMLNGVGFRFDASLDLLQKFLHQIGHMPEPDSS